MTALSGAPCLMGKHPHNTTDGLRQLCCRKETGHRTHPAALGLQGDEAAVLGAPQREDHLQAAGAVPGAQPLETEPAARQHLRPHVRPRQRCPHHLPSTLDALLGNMAACALHRPCKTAALAPVSTHCDSRWGFGLLNPRDQGPSGDVVIGMHL
jgi:hypothetical protein